MREDPRQVALAKRDLAGLRALVPGDDPAALQHVDQAARTRVAEPEPPLEHRRGGGPHLRDERDRLLQQRILVGVELLLLGLTGICSLNLFQELLMELRLTLAPPGI